MILTIGHSTRNIEEFLNLLTLNGVNMLADVRTIPRSRTNPQYNSEVLSESLASAGMQYVHMPGLGGLRHARKDSQNTGWRNDSFRGYADYMQKPEFSGYLQNLIDLAETNRIAIMCAEAVPWRCHRSLIADALTVRHIPVAHILSAAAPKPHMLTGFAHVNGYQLTYPALNTPP